MAYGKTFTPAGEQMAQHLAETGGMLTPLHPGRIFRYSTGEWNMADTWHGRELVKWKVTESLWDKGIHITFSGMANASQVDLPTFKVTLQPPMTADEITQAAETYMTLLNLRRG